MTQKEKASMILAEIEKYLHFDDLQHEYAEKGILNGLKKIETNLTTERNEQHE